MGSRETTKISGVDQAFLGEDLFLVEYILENAIFHFDCEGGLVHMATALGTKCVVLFGPTPEPFYGYEQNVNIVSPFCKNCMGATEEWMFKCIRGYSEPECMKAITPEIVMKNVEEEMKTKPYCM